jgi:hypothetical protein
MPRKTPTESVPEHLLYAGWRWETLRMCYFRTIGDHQNEVFCHGLRELYRRRLSGDGLELGG